MQFTFITTIFFDIQVKFAAEVHTMTVAKEILL